MLFRSSASERRLKKEAENWLRLADKVVAYRKDIIAPPRLEKLEAAVENLARIRRGEGGKSIKEGIDALEKILGKCGGCYYPRSGWAENIEMLLVAAILAIGIRTYFFQPFKIPTNSMYPTYNGFTHKLYEGEKEEPSYPMKIFRKIVFGASYYKILAPENGELFIPLYFETTKPVLNGIFPTFAVPGRKWLVLPTTLKEATLYLDNKPVKWKMPFDFNYDKLLRERFFAASLEIANRYDFDQWLNNQLRAHKVIRNENGAFLKTGLFFEKGDPVLSFDIQTGDALFVDRFSYHFFRPKIGDPFVFRTRNIKGITNQHHGRPEDKYYIKRLVGKPGDSLSVRNFTLFRNGKPIQGADAFAANARRKDQYDGYTNKARLASGLTERIPPQSFYAMGDNSKESSDSRVWGFVPEKEVVGKAFFIYYPFSKHWGHAR